MEKKCLNILICTDEQEKFQVLKQVLPLAGFSHDFLPMAAMVTEENCRAADIVVVDLPLLQVPEELRKWCSGWLVYCTYDQADEKQQLDHSLLLDIIDDLWVGPFSPERLKFYFRRFLREIRYAWQNLQKRTEESLTYERRLEKEIKLKTRTIRDLQQQILISFADLVNSRDHAIGDHIRNTNRYVDILLKELQREGTKPSLADQGYCDEISRAVPLHDIGKIAIPDAILNKPGGYTPEEYHIMRSHTEKGAKLIEKTLSRLENYRYYQTARNMANYHHEKWDGSGYPAGLRGKEIPLEARIMAIADVFDALISKRPYREARSLEQAYVILKAGAGVQFDPEIAAAFILARSQIEKAVREEFYRMKKE